MGANLLEISVDELFETHSIPEIDQVQKKLQSEVEKKREELRTMVGERYRDLLKAADTIGKMKETSSSVVSRIGEITYHCKVLNDKQLIGFKSGTSTFDNSSTLQDKHLNSYFSTVFQIKLLTNLPEMIWSNIDNNRYFLATQLYIFSRHISTGLQLDVDNNFIKHFSVAKKQWEILKPFYLTIKQSCTNALEKEQISKELTCDCLLALFLLEKSSLEEILNIFLHLRTKAYLATLCSSSEKGGSKRRVRDRILTSLNVLNTTISLIEVCFLGSTDFSLSKGLILDELTKLNDPSHPSTISLMNIDDTDILCVLPDIISKFRPSFETQSLPVEIIKQKVENWCLSISSVANNQLKNLFDLISSMKTLNEIQIQAFEIEKTVNLSKLNKILTPKLSSASQNYSLFYENLYKPILNARVREIIRKSWSDCMHSTCNEIFTLLESNHDVQNIDTNNTSIWLDELKDLPCSLKNAMNQDKKDNKLLMTVKGYNDDIIKICTSFNDRLGGILDDLNYFLNENYNENEVQLEKYLRELSKDNSLKFIDMINQKIAENKKNKIKDFALIAKILSALIDLCTKFKLCLTFTSMTSTKITIKISEIESKNYSEIWYQICKQFEEESFKYWKKICDEFFQEYPIQNWLKYDLENQLILQDFLNWDLISIEEKDEHDNLLQSTIKIPLQIRMSLQLYFFDLIKFLNKLIPETLPKKILRYFNTTLLQNLLEYYKKLLEKYENQNEEETLATSITSITLNQNIALQLYFDLKFLQLLFVTRDDKKEQEILQKLINLLKNHIDPFDFELFYSHINLNVKKCAIRMQYQLGTILLHSSDSLSSLLIGNNNEMKQTLMQQDKDPNVLCICSSGSTSTWFHLLPILVPNKSSTNLIQTEIEKPAAVKQQSKPENIKPQVTSSTSQVSQTTAATYTSNVKSGAAAFFGAMSQDWFR